MTCLSKITVKLKLFISGYNIWNKHVQYWNPLNRHQIFLVDRRVRLKQAYSSAVFALIALEDKYRELGLDASKIHYINLKNL